MSNSILHDSNVESNVVADACIRADGGSETPALHLRVHVQTDAHDGSTFATPVTTPITGKNIFIEKIPTISERDVAAFRAYPAGTEASEFCSNLTITAGSRSKH